MKPLSIKVLRLKFCPQVTPFYVLILLLRYHNKHINLIEVLITISVSTVTRPYVPHSAGCPGGRCVQNLTDILTSNLPTPIKTSFVALITDDKFPFEFLNWKKSV